ncbi:MAG: hypothetical protein V2I63_01855 [Pseudomonadales bacterium]|nr:hypothetical protein [Pseudomonadales bacterium]
MRTRAAGWAALLFATLLIVACAQGYDEADLRAQMKAEHARVFSPMGWTLRDFTRLRVEPIGDETLVVHAEYLFEGRNTGTDRRIFVFERRGSDWALTSMGEHESARFD